MKISLLALPILVFVSGCARKPAGPVWDVPTFVGLPIDQAKAKLGAPQTEVTVDTSQTQSVWTREGATLTATWKPTNKRVTSWKLVSREEKEAASEEKRAALLKAGNFKEGDARYSVDYVEAPNRPLFYTGVRIVPALKNHQVVLRLSGSPSLVQVDYDAGGKGGSTLTIAPWSETFTLPDDSKISLSASFFKSISGSASDMKIEILSDGKVIGSDAASGGSVTCEAEL